MQTYIGCKIIQAKPMDKPTNETSKAKVIVPGYRVVYPDGYASWSPKKVFEEAYRLISDSEKRLILKSVLP